MTPSIALQLEAAIQKAKRLHRGRREATRAFIRAATDDLKADLRSKGLLPSDDKIAVRPHLRSYHRPSNQAQGVLF